MKMTNQWDNEIPLTNLTTEQLYSMKWRNDLNNWYTTDEEGNSEHTSSMPFKMALEWHMAKPKKLLLAELLPWLYRKPKTEVTELPQIT